MRLTWSLVIPRAREPSGGRQALNGLERCSEMSMPCSDITLTADSVADRPSIAQTPEEETFQPPVNP